MRRQATVAPPTRPEEALMTHVPRWRRGVVAAVVLVLAATAAAPADDANLQPPVITVLQHSPADAPGLVFVGPKHQAQFTGPQGAEIVDDLGRPVWFRPAEIGQIYDFRVQRYQGRRVLTWFDGVITE